MERRMYYTYTFPDTVFCLFYINTSRQPRNFLFQYSKYGLKDRIRNMYIGGILKEAPVREKLRGNRV